jgi:hypothetical protein
MAKLVFRHSTINDIEVFQTMFQTGGGAQRIIFQELYGSLH